MSTAFAIRPEVTGGLPPELPSMWDAQRALGSTPGLTTATVGSNFAYDVPGYEAPGFKPTEARNFRSRLWLVGAAATLTVSGLVINAESAAAGASGSCHFNSNGTVSVDMSGGEYGLKSGDYMLDVWLNGSNQIHEGRNVASDGGSITWSKEVTTSKTSGTITEALSMGPESPTSSGSYGNCTGGGSGSTTHRPKPKPTHSTVSHPKPKPKPKPTVHSSAASTSHHVTPPHHNSGNGGGNPVTDPTTPAANTHHVAGSSAARSTASANRSPSAIPTSPAESISVTPSDVTPTSSAAGSPSAIKSSPVAAINAPRGGGPNWNVLGPSLAGAAVALGAVALLIARRRRRTA